MRVKGNSKISIMDISYLERVFKITVQQAYLLKKGKEAVDIDNAAALVKAGFVDVIDIPKPKKAEKPIQLATSNFSKKTKIKTINEEEGE